VFGFYLEPIENNNKLNFEYKACKYNIKKLEEEKSNKNVYTMDIPKEIKNAKMKDIFLDDKSRKEAINWLVLFVKNYDKKTKTKGLYLNGNFGSGKTYLIAAAFNELAKKDIRSAIIYWPEFIRTLKASFDDDFKEKFEHIKRIPLLLIDDIGAENVTPWGRDEILGTILQYRMEEGLTTFFTSNLNYEELETALSVSRNKVDSLKATRIMERIKNLTINMTMIGENKRD
jgi:primosomal protein DnaI